MLTALDIAVSSANINTGSGEGPVRDIFRITGPKGGKVRTAAAAGVGTGVVQHLHAHAAAPLWLAGSCIWVQLGGAQRDGASCAICSTHAPSPR